MNKVKVVWYHHTSEDQITDDRHLLLFRLIDAHIFVSDYSKKKFTEKLIHFDEKIEEKSFVIRNGVNTDKFSYNIDLRKEIRDTYKIPEKSTVVLFIGKITPRKGLEELLASLKLLPDELLASITVLIIGATDYFNVEKTAYISKMENIARELKCSTIFTGYIPHHQIHKFYCASDMLIFPSIEEEGLPLTILEAQSVGLPVISSDVGGINEIIIHGENGYIYPRNSEPKVISDLLETLCRSPLLRQQFSRNSKRNIYKNFSRERMACDFENVIEKIYGFKKS